MKIAVNTRLLIKDKLEGIGTFSAEILRRMTLVHPEHDFYFFFDRPYASDFIFSKNVTPIILSPQARHPFLYYIWFEYSVAKKLKELKADVFLSPDGYLSLSTDVKQVQVLHDLNFEEDSFGIPWLELKYFRNYFPKFSKKATRIATVSEHSKMDIQKRYGIEAKKIDVVYNAAREGFRPFRSMEKDQVRQKFSDGNPYFICVGSIHPRKNIPNLLKAFDLYKEKKSCSDKLLIVGNSRGRQAEVSKVLRSMKHEREVQFVGRLSESELEALTASAIASMNVSLFEGFGIPMIEAMACEVPVIASNQSALPEIAGGAALLVNPRSPQEISEAMYRIKNDELLREDLIVKGIEQAKEYSWEQSAKLLWTSLEKANQS